ncbi:hypothetical protein SERLA73DRAFT_133625 [Serpula lacrymans var. lacrymans S7.3]|uniref:SnoaL-like domain-containing protein n=2 Tax=Serpula lacrymans var. lacrymans TaxID=341189 RepID=F8PRZ2_SERL3|nr:uncharacterized protein SERLADRAFT_384582 [Serpula lacrymans var. lacrymans S7.9]EGO00658.1 hypothetical protein SERLA73DRAFT_133625 [Serpula lacrymans var. lacrymans S7.3]EGO26210.1 hypothetical protein SERLADRAFT_384582 [Serpula lacrymans var. lacrymans S7.9]
MSASTLSSWVQSRLSAVYEAAEDDAFYKAFDAVFSPSCQVTHNHASISRDALKDALFSRRAASIGAQVKWDDNVITAAAEKNSNEAGIVAGSFVVQTSMKFRIRAAPAQRQTLLHFSAKVEQDDAVAADETGDRRRIISFLYTTLDRTPPIHFQVPPTEKAVKQD